MDSKQRHLVNKYIDLFLRRKIILISLLLMSIPVGLGLYLVTPKVYQATSLLSYQQQKISPNKLSPDISSRIRDTVSSLTLIVTSRTNLENLIVYYKLYPRGVAKLPLEDVVESMRKKIRIEPSKLGDIFKITFQHGSPEKVVKVTNALASKFIEENLKYREERASETSSYTSDELQMAKTMMDRKESAMRDYKIKHYNEMPEQRITNVSRLIALQEQYQGKQDSIQDLERTLVLIQDQIGNRRKVLEGEYEESTLSDEDQVQSGFSDRPIGKTEKLIRLNRLLQNMLTRYTDLHPEVKKTRKLIQQIEAEIENNPVEDDHYVSTEQDLGNNADRGRVKRGLVDNIILQLETQRKNVLLNIENIKLEKEQLKTKVAQYEEWVTAAPVREAEWSSLTREYGQQKRHYEYLVAQDLEAKSMLNLERRQKGSQFKIEDPARFPEKPIKPDFFAIMGMSILGCLGLGIGFTLIIDFFDSSFRDPDLIETTLGVPLLTTIPYIETNAESRKLKRNIILQVGFILLAVFLIVSLLLVVWLKGYIVI